MYDLLNVYYLRNIMQIAYFVKQYIFTLYVFNMNMDLKIFFFIVSHLE